MVLQYQKGIIVVFSLDKIKEEVKKLSSKEFVLKAQKMNIHIKLKKF